MTGFDPTRLFDASEADFRLAADRIRADAIHTPLLPFGPQDGARRVKVKAENLQPYGSFKIRCGANALAAYNVEALKGGVATGSAGNFAQGLALAARRLGVPVAVHVPDTAAEVKLGAVRALGATVTKHSFADWWTILSTRSTGANDGVFIHPVAEADVVLGNGTVALELLQDWPELDTVIVPVGGGGLICGIALAFRALGRKVRIVAAEIETSIPLTAALAAGEPVKVERGASFVDGIGSTGVLPDMWPLLKDLVDETVVVTTEEAKSALRRLALENHIIVEGAGATALAAALKYAGGTNVVAVLSGGNIDPSVYGDILNGR
jgi:threonine dehydratase